MSTLEDLKEDRRRQAAERNILSKAEAIARHLGADQKPHRGIWHVFEEGRLKIEFLKGRERSDEDYATSGTSIEADGQTVYAFSDDHRLDEQARYAGIVGLTCYIPGDWEAALEELHARATRKAEEAAEAMEAERKRAVAEYEAAERKWWEL